MGGWVVGAWVRRPNQSTRERRRTHKTNTNQTKHTKTQAGLLRGTSTGASTAGADAPGVNVNPRVGEAVRQIAQEHVLPGVVALLNQV